jgi:predicted secreted protein
MAWTTAAAIYFVIWWVVLFAVLPFGVRSHADAGTEAEPGHDPGAPTTFGMNTKLIWTTLIACVVFGIFWVIYVNRLISLEELATLWGLLKYGQH